MLAPSDVSRIADELAARIRTQPSPSTEDFDDLKAEVHQLRADIHEILAAWRTANALVGFVKWVASILGALAVVWAAVTTRNFWNNGGA